MKAARSSGTEEAGVRTGGGEAGEGILMRGGAREDWVWMLTEWVGCGKVWARTTNWSRRTKRTRTRTRTDKRIKTRVLNKSKARGWPGSESVFN